MGKKKKQQAPSDMPEGGLAALFAQSQPQAQNPFSEGTAGHQEWQQQNTNPYQTGTSGWSEWQREHGLPLTNVIDPKTGRGIDASGNYTYGDPGLDAYAKGLKKDDLWRFQKMEEHMAGKSLDAMTPKTGEIFAEFKGPLEFLRNAGVASKKTGGGDEANLTRELQMMADRGMQWGNTAMKNSGQISRMAPDLARWGVRSLSDLQAFEIPGRGTLYYNKGNNTVLPADFGSSMHGEGGTYFSLKNVNGHVLPTTQWTDTSDRQAIMGGLSVLGAAAGLGGLGAALGGAMGTSTAVGNAAVGAGMGALQGGVSGGWEGALKGALTGGLGGAVSAVNPAGMAGVTNPALQAGMNSAISGGLRSAIGGGNVLQGAVSGGMGGALGSMFGPLGGYAGGAFGNYLFGNNAPTRQQIRYGTPTPATSGGLSQARTAAPMQLPPGVLARIREGQAKLHQAGRQTGGLENLANWGQKNLGWTA